MLTDSSFILRPALFGFLGWCWGGLNKLFVGSIVVIVVSDTMRGAGMRKAPSSSCSRCMSCSSRFAVAAIDGGDGGQPSGEALHSMGYVVG
jgi:hypothetical protein